MINENKTVSITDSDIEKEANRVHENCFDKHLLSEMKALQDMAKWARDEMLSRNVISIQRDKAIEVLVTKMKHDDTDSLDYTVLYTTAAGYIDALIESNLLTDGKQ